MATAYAANVTKVRAGGSGDNVVHDGFIKTVEKVWIDTFAEASGGTAWNLSSNSLVIAKVPRGKKITDVIVYIPAMGSVSTTLITLYCSYGTLSPTTLTPSLGTLRVDSQGKTGSPSSTASTYRLDTAYIGTVVPTLSTGLIEDMDIHITCAATSGLTILTGGTVTAIVKYT